MFILFMSWVLHKKFQNLLFTTAKPTYTNELHLIYIPGDNNWDDYTVIKSLLLQQKTQIPSTNTKPQWFN